MTQSSENEVVQGPGNTMSYRVGIYRYGRGNVYGHGPITSPKIEPNPQQLVSYLDPESSLLALQLKLFHIEILEIVAMLTLQLKLFLYGPFCFLDI